MNILHLFRPTSGHLFCKELNLGFISPIGINFSGIQVSAGHIKFALDTAFSYAVLDAADISDTLDLLKKLPRETNLFIHLDVKGKYMFDGRKKSLVSAFAILYDFVDAFVISGYRDLEKDIEPLLTQRLYNDESRPIILQIKSDTPAAEMDRILDYARISSIDGLLIDNPGLLEYVSNHCEKGQLTLIADGINTYDALEDAMMDNATLFTVSQKRKYRHWSCNPIRLGRKLTRTLIKSIKPEKMPADIQDIDKS